MARNKGKQRGAGHDPSGILPMGQAISPLRDHARASNMDDVQLEGAMHVKDSKVEDQVKRFVTGIIPVLVCPLSH